MKKLSIIIALCFVCIMGNARSIVSGDFDFANSFWEFDEETGILTIGVLDHTNTDFEHEGVVYGALPDFDAEAEIGLAPWFGTFGEDIKSIVIEDGIVRVGSRSFAQCYYVENVSLPDGLIEIGEYAFMQLGDILEIIVPEGVNKLEKGAFEGCASLQTVSLPSTLETIGQYCFAGCTSLARITYNAEKVHYLPSNAFEGVDCASIVLYVPAESVEDYKYYSDWAEFTIQAIGDEPAEPIDEDVCQVVSTGDVDFVHSDMMETPDDEGGYNFYLYTNSAWTLENRFTPTKQPGNGEMFEITIHPEDPTNMAGMYENDLTILMTVKNGSAIDHYYRTAGTLIITLSESGNTYDFVYNLTMENSSDDTDTRTLQGTIIGVCTSIDIAQGIDDINADKVAAKKQMRDGVLLIEAGGKTYNAQGVEIK